MTSAWEYVLTASDIAVKVVGTVVGVVVPDGTAVTASSRRLCVGSKSPVFGRPDVGSTGSAVSTVLL